MNARPHARTLSSSAVAAPHTPGGAYAQAAFTAPAAVQALAGQHPAEYYKRAGELFQEGKKDDAVFLFYLGQLRYRTLLLAKPSTDPTADPAIFASLSEVTGKPINQYAFGDIPALARTIDAVLAYDTANPDTFTPPATIRQSSRRRSRRADSHEDEDARRSRPHPREQRRRTGWKTARREPTFARPRRALQHQQRAPNTGMTAIISIKDLSKTYATRL